MFAVDSQNVINHLDNYEGLPVDSALYVTIVFIII